MSLAGRRCLLTGATQGIGRATALALAAQGADLVLAARSRADLDDLASALAPYGVAVFTVATDLSVAEQRERLVAAALDRFGAIEVLINNAAVGLDAPIEEQSIDEGRYLFELNLFAPLHLIQLLLPTMRQQPQGQIVQISSIVGLRAVPNSALYCASKYALNGLSDALRAELQGSHIVVTSIYPGVTRTNFVTNQLRSPRIRPRKGAVPPEQVAAVIVEAIRKRQRARYITWRDRTLVAGTTLLPAPAEWLLGRLFRRRRGS
ncbi:MAG: SDR family NAD(P)-dependent oxidoreductase [Anaerolineales bacterium]|nr:SDR family NAD(P)-dependent oxidoreductase [Anaerolineales bacterium]MCB9126379.1 SDR family NAD(P)-dependent oxidoreductase [Ardenticatenales bacterium]MCB9171540.1 SDR family NAD(P)-dependent oxidoreductase [Ardenticatenales bacterium]